MTRSIKLLPISLIALSVFMLFGCSVKTAHNYTVPKSPMGSDLYSYQPEVSQLSIKAYGFMLADELLTASQAQTIKHKVIAVTRFVEQAERTDNPDNGAPLSDLGGQLEESFIYELNKRGFRVVDYKAMSQINMTDKGDLIWSRDLAKLDSGIDFEVVLSGTMTAHENGAIVNIRMLDIQNKQVVATAMGFIPSNVLWSQNQIMSREGILIHKGEHKRIHGVAK